MRTFYVNDVSLFQPNDLSVAKREFIPLTDPGRSGQVLSVLPSYFDVRALSTVETRYPNEQRSMAHCFSLTVGGVGYFLKCRRGPEAGRRLIYEAGLAAQLFERGMKVPRLILSLKKEEVVVQGEDYFALYSFFDGTHFSGDGRQLDAAAESFGDLTKVATDSFKELMPIDSGRTFLEDLQSLVLEATGNNSLDQDFRRLWKKHLPVLVNSLEVVKDQWSVVHADVKVLHTDYHPLNILMNQDEVVSILDLEDLRAYPVLAALGFGGYKLIRQMLINPETRAKEFSSPSLVQRWLAGWYKSFPDSRVTATDLGLGARYRVLSLIYVILNDYVRCGNRTYNYDLAKQLKSLYEINLIFGGDSSTC